MRFYQKWTAARFDPEGKERYPRFDAEVPGNVQYDYARSIGLDDIAYSDNVEKLAGIEDWYWEYRAELAYTVRAGESAWLVAEGIDYAFDILLNGRKVCSQEGMYTPVCIPAESGLLQIVIHPHPRRALEPGEPNRSAADQSCKPAVGYGWDFHPRLPASGLWMPVYVETRGSGFIRSAEPFYTLSADRARAFVRFVTDCDEPVDYTVTDPDGAVVYAGRSPEFTLDGVRLWWCAGHGEQALYRWTAATAADEKQGTIGFRTVRLVQNAGANFEPRTFPKSRYPAWVTLELNGKRIFIKGTNLTDTDLFPGRVTRERYEELVRLAAQCNMNAFRVWGGGGMKKPEFYELCDRYGMLVWQEFPLACNSYDGTVEYLAVLEREAAAMIRRLRSHACLFLWCGGNELFNNWSGMDEQSHALRLLNKLCFELDRERPFLFTSPLNGMGHGCYSFFDTGTGKDVLELFTGAHFTAYPEFGVPALAPADALEKIIPPEERFPIADTPAWKLHHALNDPAGGRHYERESAERFWGPADDLAGAVASSQRLQADGLQNIFEEARRQWPYCSMALNWCWNEPWPAAANLSVLSYPSVKKPAYDAVRAALRPVMASARVGKYLWKSGELFTAELWLLNESDGPIDEQIAASVELAGERHELLTWHAKAAPGENARGPVVQFTLPQAEAAELRLILETAAPERASAYRLCFENVQPPKIKRRLNV